MGTVVLQMLCAFKNIQYGHFKQFLFYSLMPQQCLGFERASDFGHAQSS